jgi:tetratricopeptide (TPR) repeat protein
MAYFAMGDLEQAATVLKEALDGDPDAVELAPLLAATYAQLGRREEARAALLQYQPGASQLELQNLGFVYHFSQLELQNLGFVYHFPYYWAAEERANKDRLIDGLHIAALPLEATVLSLADTLQHGDLSERRFAVQALGRFGSAAADAVPALIETLDDEVSWVRNDAIIALGKIGPAAEAAIPALTAMQDEGAHSYYVKQALKKIRDM